MQGELTTLRLAVTLADVSTRTVVSEQLAARLGVDQLLVFTPDPELGLLIPAPGWPQTIAQAAPLRALLADCHEPGAHRLQLQVQGRAPTPIVALSDGKGTVLALIGGTPADAEVRELAMVLPLLASTLRAELASHVAEGNAASAREASRHSQALAAALDATRGQLESSLRRSAVLAEEAERARQRVALLDRITRELVGDLSDVDGALSSVADAVVPSLADWCAVYVLDTDGAIRVATLSHVDAAARDDARRMVDTHALDPSAGWGIPQVLRTGTSNYVPAITEERLRAAAHDEQHFEQLKRWGATSHLAVALKGHENTLGVLALTMTSSRVFTDDDRALAEEIANRAALLVEQRRLLVEARAARLEAEHASRAKDEFLAMLGHELRNPLAPISTALSLMKMRDDGALREERAVIERQIRHVVQLVDDLLDVSRITRGKIELRRETLGVHEIVTTAAEMALPMVEERRHHLTVEVEDGLYVEGDARRLAQVISNLLNNAAKYTPDGGTLRLRASEEGGDVVIRVIDDGSGIDADLLPRVFELFTQAPQTTDRSQGGLGLGLTIVKRLVALHGGTVIAKSDGPGKGSEFVVRLPAAGPPEPRQSSAPRKSGAPVARRRVLVVDDNQDAAWLLTELLRAVGHDAEMAFDGPSALLKLDGFAPDAALLDIGLPVMDGFELARRVRARLPRIFLVAVTGYGQAADRAATSAAGFDAHLVKPVDIDDVSRVLSP